MELSFIKKILIVLIVLLVVFNFSGRLEPIQKAHAIFCSNCSQWWKDVVQWGKESYQWSKEYIYPALRDAAIKRIMDQIADDTVKWIEGGGEPRFVSDWNGFLEDNFSAAVGDVVLQTRAAPICSPFKVQIGFMLLPKRTLSERARCTIEDIGLNLQNFYDNFSNGGWIGYSESWAPQNNYFMTAMMVYDEALIAGQKAQQAKTKEAEGGKGFLPVKKCIPASSDKMQEMLDACLVQQGEENYDLCQQETEERAKCFSEKIITPGDAVGEAFRGAVTSDSQFARSAQSALSVIIDALINRTVKEGIDYVKDAGQRDQQRKNDQKKQDDIEKTNYQQNIKPMLTSIGAIRKEWDYIRNVKQQSYDAITGPNGLLATLNEMQSRNCQPPYSATVAEINDAQTISARLLSEVTDFQNKIAEADEISLGLNDAIDGTDRERMISQQDAIDFDNKYNTSEMQEQISDGLVRQAVDEELTELQGGGNFLAGIGKLPDARNRLQLCIQAQTPQY